MLSLAPAYAPGEGLEVVAALQQRHQSASAALVGQARGCRCEATEVGLVELQGYMYMCVCMCMCMCVRVHVHVHVHVRVRVHVE